MISPHFNIKNIFKNNYHIIIIILVSLLPLTWFRSAFINGGDFCWPMTKSLEGIWPLYASVWVDKWGTGLVNSRAITQLPFIWLLEISSKLVSLAILERVLFVALFLIAGAGMYLLAGCFPITLKNRKFFNISVAVFYLFNPSNLIFGWHFLDGSVFVFAFFPILLFLFSKWFQTKQKRYLLLFSLVPWFAGYTLSNPLYVFMLWVMLLGFALIFFVLDKNRKFIKFIGSLVGLVIFWILVNAWWIIPLFVSLKDEFAGLSASLGSPELTLSAFSMKTSLLNLFRLSGFYWAFGQSAFGDAYYSYASLYFSKTFRLLSYILPIVWISSLFVKERRPKLIVYSLFFMLIPLFFLAKGIQPPLGVKFFGLLFKVPFMAAFRAPVQKTITIIVIIISILFGFGLHRIYVAITEKKRKKVAAITVGCILLALSFYAYPLFTGEVIIRKGKKRPSNHVSVPQYYAQASNWLDKDLSDYRFYPIPQSATMNVAYKWKNGYIGGDPSFFFFSKRGVYSAIDEITRFPYQQLKKYDRNIFQTLRLLNVKYIILHKDVDNVLWVDFSKYRTPSYLEERLSKQNHIEKVNNFGKLVIYKLDDSVLLPHVYAATEKKIVFKSSYIRNLNKLRTFDKLPAVFLLNQQPLANKNRIRNIVSHKEKVKLKFQNISPYELRVNYDAKKPFFIIFQETFHPKWRLVYGDLNWSNRMGTKMTEETRHYKVNGYANAWYVRPGKRKATIFFSSQSSFNQGLMVSLITLLFGFIYSVIKIIWKKKTIQYDQEE